MIWTLVQLVNESLWKAEKKNGKYHLSLAHFVLLCSKGAGEIRILVARSYTRCVWCGIWGNWWYEIGITRPSWRDQLNMCLLCIEEEVTCAVVDLPRTYIPYILWIICHRDSKVLLYAVCYMGWLYNWRHMHFLLCFLCTYGRRYTLVI